MTEGRGFCQLFQAIRLDRDVQKKLTKTPSLCQLLIETWDSHRENAHDIIDVQCVSEVSQMFRRVLSQGGDNAFKAINLLFDRIPFEKFTTETIKFYFDAFDLLGATYFDAYENTAKREEIEKFIRYTEEKVKTIEPVRIRTEMYRPLIFAFTGMAHNDWKKYNTKFSYKDKEFLNDQFSKYGMYHVKDVIFTIYMFHINELLPEILMSLYTVFEEARKLDNKVFTKDIYEMIGYINRIILDAFMKHSDEIKKENGLIEAYEGILSILVQLNNPQAAIILDEFRIH